MFNSILDKIEFYSREHPQRHAVKFLDNTITYSEFEKKIEAVSEKICRYKNDRSEPVMIFMDRGLEFVVSMFGVLKSGCYYIPVEYPYPEERINMILGDSNCRIVVTLERYKQYFGENVEVICIDKDECESDSNNYVQAVNDEDLSYIIYTSGTTGTPKGVKIMYSNLSNLIESFYDIIYKENGKVLNVGVTASFSFDASVKQIFCALFFGHTLIIAEKETKLFKKRMEHFLRHNDIDIIDMTPTVLKLLCIQKMSEVSKEIIILLGGEILTWENLDDSKNVFTNAKYINVYGPTECCVDSSYYIIDKSKIETYKGIVPIGRPLKNTCLEIEDENGNKVCEEGVGELCIIGAQVGAGYVGITSDKFTLSEDGQKKYYTGDIAEYKNGEIYILGRNDSQIKINGYRVDVNEIVELTKKYGIKEAAIAVKKRNNSDVLTMYYYNEVEVNEKHICEYLKKILPKYMIPKEYIKMDNMPVNRNGKLDIGNLI